MSITTLKDLGLTEEISCFLKDNNLSELTVGRVTRENRDRYVVSTGETEYDAEITGNLRFTASSRTDFPAVGDWVAMTLYEPDQAIIHRILPRKSVLERQAVGKPGEKQIISANVDFALIVQSIDNNFSVNRLERYMTICFTAGIEPVLVISKVDLAGEEEVNNAINELTKRDRTVKYILLSNITQHGLDQIMDLIQKGKTYCVIGSSGVGKSTLINNLLRKDLLKTGQISRSTNKGRHITGHRELFVLENGGIVIDNPGMRELGMTESTEGIKTTFREILNLSLQCKFPDCRHINETGCTVLEALEKGIIDRKSLENFRKIEREQQLFQSTVAERRRKDRQFGRLCKQIMNEKKKNKF